MVRPTLPTVFHVARRMIIWKLTYATDSDYTIFVWRRQQQHQEDHSLHAEPEYSSMASTSRTVQFPPTPTLAWNTTAPTPTLHLHNPKNPLPSPPAYLNPAYFTFQPSRAQPPPTRRSPVPSHASLGKRSKKGNQEDANDGIPDFKKQFESFHSANGVRTVMGTIGPVQNGWSFSALVLYFGLTSFRPVRMLLKSGYRHVYISRKFAIKHGFIPPDAAPGHYGYGGLVNIGSWPITLTPSSTQPNLPASRYQRPDAFRNSPSPSHTPYSSSRIPSPTLLPPKGVNGWSQSIRNPNREHYHQNGGYINGPKSVSVEVYLSEEPHFDVVLGRSFCEKRQIKTTAVDPTDVVCLDTGEKIECELVILKDGRGEIVTVT